MTIAFAKETIQELHCVCDNCLTQWVRDLRVKSQKNSLALMAYPISNIIGIWKGQSLFNRTDGHGLVLNHEFNYCWGGGYRVPIPKEFLKPQGISLFTCTLLQYFVLIHEIFSLLLAPSEISQNNETFIQMVMDPLLLGLLLLICP
ncbi:hypothetical protein Ahy_B03g061789 isoform D [Arachis hypogaea]|uniref:Uncharacterized protein n=1 Tax=Arachis hypogaea TaxID=3818 RepID=A0A444ZS07_ARAHY|nr:hypothetical protein Ahy_B03g061789 isoform D [Arachis hypogaea]